MSAPGREDPLRRYIWGSLIRASRQGRLHWNEIDSTGETIVAWLGSAGWAEAAEAMRGKTRFSKTPIGQRLGRFMRILIGDGELRRQPRHVELGDVDLACDDDPAVAAEESELSRAVKEAFNELPDPEQKIIEGRRDGKTFNAIAVELGMPLTTVHRQYNAAKKRLAAALAPHKD
jgi:RNA polymerase sigma factor (sigma-70 family)